MEFEMTHRYGPADVEKFNVDNAPDWLKFGGVEGSTMCNRWFWNDHIMKLEIGKSIETDFRKITRVK